MHSQMSRRMAHEALADKVSCYEGPGEVRDGLSHDWVCDAVTEMIEEAAEESAKHLAERLLRAEQLNAELARMLRSLEWAMQIRNSGEVYRQCLSCLIVRDDGTGLVRDHYSSCALAALLKKATTA